MSTQIPQPTLTPTATPSSAAIITPTASPTLLPELIDERLSALMHPNEDCLLPCWWGIMPGKTTLQETDQILNSVGATSFSNHMFAIGGNGWGLGVNLTLDQEDIIQSIEITSTAAYADDKAKYWDDWQANSVAEVLRRNGVPSQVITYIPFQADAGGGQAYKLFLFYEEAGVMVEYTGYAESLDGSIYRVCPDLQRFTQIRLLLYRPEKVESMLSTLFPPDQLDYLWSGITYDDITWEGITGTDLEAFHELFTSNAPDEACYEIPHIVDIK